ncbi:type III secretion system export apparatus subunit SctV [Erwinia psidii]|uniref:EscV/YscV/HrcV family type III secretion system export apparatus protein n=1 Tax=Erwinia psidii TaxID=69224 RepID=A0A3N6SEN3_9GAMM|nr:type III secretion system export apparatus subunit SctV [Erwinia psidii]MCX8956565.1 EscV/YscV/HrcV family type III secretion system export apparatus protein [Erwinia psidii]MCX8961525.1 EscV/YscV/HrcV family type III secretion system export apparatus protein [Erwinia psidii]MCX8965007.1 EscV/YscV/HrcV family type III secretion system export apparatus protein [Erwinia psidii]RQM39900.1 EscV/YscV/HrcV family type III secretion system export apparatus protein [Erwinia psidii]
MTAITDFLANLTRKMVRQTELIVIVIVMTIIFMMILPMPLWVIDMAISLNICIASLLAIKSLFLPYPLAFSTFPAVLLMTTMFRLALSVGTARLILLQHDAGHIVETFGNFVVGGNLAVGLVIFLILTLVNFLVITKGAERVAEVSARFTLDAMPGKQMAIDSDLRSGLIDTAEAQIRRKQLTSESQLFGAMDGAMKFVKGDAIAGIIIVFVNLVGGLAVGILQQGMAAADAMHIYSVLSIGDGLIAQIPALLISFSAGIIITRVTTDKSLSDISIANEIASQLMRESKSWLYVAVIMMLFSAIPGMPTSLFASLSLSCLFLFFFLYRQEKRGKMQESQPFSSGDSDERSAILNEENVRRFFPLRAYLMQFHPQHQGSPECLELSQRLHSLRNQYVFDYGLMLPNFDLEFSPEVSTDEFRFCMYEAPLIRATFDSSKYAVKADLVNATEDVLGTEERGEQEWCWLASSDPRFSTDKPDYCKSSDLIAERMKNAIQATGWQFIGLQECRTLIEWLKEVEPELAQELERSIPLTCFADILRQLAAEHITLRPLRLIVESILQHYQHDASLVSLTEQVRCALKWQICQQYCHNDRLNCWLLTQSCEDIFFNGLISTNNENRIELNSQMQEALMVRLKTRFPAHQQDSSVLLVEQNLRGPLANLLRESLSHIPILSFSELTPTVTILVKGRIDLEDQEA